MSTKTTIGHVDCPICGHVGAEIRLDKNDRAYIHCKHACGWQGITRNNHQSDQLKARMRPCTVPVPTVTVPEPAAPQALTPAKPAPRPPGAAKAPPPSPKPEPAPSAPKPKASWLLPILGGANG